MVEASALKIMIIGRTGDGKTQLCAALSEFLEAKDIQFKPSGLANSHRCPILKAVMPCKLLGRPVKIIDTPGLCDTEGAVQDTDNLLQIVKAAKDEQSIHVFILVINEQSARFDQGCQDAVKILCDSFKKEVFDNLCIVYTRKDPYKDDIEARAHCADIGLLIARRCSLPLDSLTDITHYRVNSLDKASVQEPFLDMLRWGAAKEAYPTTAVVAAKSDRQKEQEALVAEQKLHAAARKEAAESAAKIKELQDRKHDWKDLTHHFERGHGHFGGHWACANTDCRASWKQNGAQLYHTVESFTGCTRQCEKCKAYSYKAGAMCLF
ncbi:MAG TPA: GTPase [Candidatus Paceibacterota bacterium]|nr:GTPase [Candidatus Paceibacterota bacterium]